MATSANRTASGGPSATARKKFGGKDGSFPVFDKKSASSALDLLGRSPDPSSVLARVRARATKMGWQDILTRCDTAAKNLKGGK
jgi:hypothetical protein